MNQDIFHGRRVGTRGKSSRKTRPRGVRIIRMMMMMVIIIMIEVDIQWNSVWRLAAAGLCIMLWPSSAAISLREVR